ncbi:pyruvate formate lyase family protein [Escherichia coli]
MDFEIDGEYPQYGNNDERVDSIACDLVERLTKKLNRCQPIATPSLPSRF